MIYFFGRANSLSEESKASTRAAFQRDGLELWV